jgi:hypothetical protein
MGQDVMHVGKGAAMIRSGPFTIEVVRGEPIQAYGRTLAPVARIAWAVKHQGIVRQGRVEGKGWGFVHAEPLAVIEEREGEVRSLPVQGSTAWILGRMALVAVAVSVLTLALVFAGWLRQAWQPVCDEEV